MHALINLDFTQEVSNVADSDDPWDQDDVSTIWFIPSEFTVTENMDGWGEFLPLNFTPEKGKVYFLVYAIYSNGDSFHHEENGGCELIGLYTDMEEAERNAEILRRSNEFSEKITVNGTEMTVSLPWQGFFEDLECVKVTPMTCKGFK